MADRLELQRAGQAGCHIAGYTELPNHFLDDREAQSLSAVVLFNSHLIDP